MLSFDYFLKSILRSWKHQPAVQGAALLVLSSTLTIVFTFYLVFSNIERVIVSWGADLEMNIYLDDSINPDQQNAVKKFLTELNKFKEVNFLDKKDVAKGFFQKMARYIPEFKQDDEFLTMVPASFVGKFNPSTSIEELPQIAASINKLTGVEDVSYGQEWVQNFSVFLSAIRKTGWSVVAILLLGGLFVIGYSIKAIVVQRRDEIEVLELVGATANLIRAPYIVEGAFLGVCSAALALFASLALYQLQDRLLLSEVSFWGIGNSFQFYKWYQVFVLLIVGGALGSGTAFLCVRKINSGWAALNEKT